MKGQGKFVGEHPGNAGSCRRQENIAGSRRRRGLRIGAVVCVAVVGLAMLAVVFRYGGARHDSALGDLAIGKSPEVAALLREAASVVDQLVERFPDDPDSLDVMAWFHFRFGKSDEAVAYWQKCVELNPEFAEAYSRIGSIARDSGEHEKAADCFRKALELEPGSPNFPVHLAQALMKMGKLEEAIGVLQKSLKAHPKSMPSFVLLGDIYVQLEEYEKAKPSLERAIEIAPDVTGGYYGLAMACAALGEETKSKEYAQKFKALKARDEKAHRDGLKAFDNVSRMRHGVAEVYTAASKAYLAHGDPRTAEEHLLRAADLCPSHAECLKSLVWLYERQNRTEKALAPLLRAKEDDPGNVSVNMTLGSLHVSLGQIEAAEEAFRDAIEVIPHQAGGYAALADLYLKANRKLPEAKRLALKVVELEPLARNYYLLSAACMGNGEPAEARSAMERAMALDPGNPVYRRTYELIGQNQAE